MKMLATCAYDAFCQMKKIQLDKPTYHQNDADVPLIDEKDLDLLIAASRKKLRAFLSCLKQTFADPSEILNCDWIDLKGNTLCIKHPVKGHLPGKYELTPQLLAWLNAFPHKSKRIFTGTYNHMYSCLQNTRHKAAERFQNPALLQITFKSFRHWGGTKVAYESKGNILTIMSVLRHKSFKSSLRYIHAVEFKDEDFETVVGTTPEDIIALGKAGWQKYDEMVMNGVQMHFYRKPKTFTGGESRYSKSGSGDDRFLCAPEVSKVSHQHILDRKLMD